MALETETQAINKPSDDAPEEDADRYFGPYKAFRLLGRGGMGAVYLAEQQQPIRRLVALKVIKPGMDTRAVIARFESERQALALMEHPNIARVFDAGTGNDKRPYFAMEYVPGTPITEYCDRNQMTNRERLELFIAVCQAVQHAHQKGIIHRDIKPSNVLVSVQDGVPVPKVIDFGVAKAINQKLIEGSFFTEHGVLVGTPEYMSPEQAEPDGLNVDTTSDIYSLGILLYELLAGVLPFDPKVLRRAGYSEMLRIIREEETPRPTARLDSLGAEVTEIATRRNTTPEGLKKQLRGDLDWITLKAMEKDRSRRYPSTSEFVADIRRHLDSHPVLAGPPRRLYRAQKFMRRHRLVVTAGMLIAASLIAGAGVALFQAEVARSQRARADAKASEAAQQARQAEEQRRLAVEQWRRAEEQTKLAERQRQRAEDQRQQAQRQSYLANLNAAELHISSNETAEAKQNLLACPRELRGWEWRHLFLRADSSLATLTPHLDPFRASVDFPVSSFAFSGDRVFWHTEYSLEAWDSVTYRTMERYSNFGNIIAISPDATKLISKALTMNSEAHRVLRVFDRISGTLTAMLLGQSEVVSAAFSPGRDRAIAVTRDSTLVEWDTNSGKVIATMKAQPNTFQAVFSHDGKYLVSTGSVSTASTGVDVWNVDTGERVWALEGPTDGAVSVAFSPDDRQIVTGSRFGAIRIWDVASGRRLLVIGGKYGAILSVAYSPDASRVLAGTPDGAVRVWDAFSGQLTETLLGHDSGVIAIAFTPDGKRILTAQRAGWTVRVWDASFCSGVRTLTGHAMTINAVTFSPNRKLLASASGDATIRLWRVDSGKIDRVLMGHGSGVTTVAFSPDNRLLASGSYDRTIRIWDVNRGEVVQTFLGHRDRINSVAFSPDGKRLVSGSSDSTIGIWDVALGKQVSTINVANPVNSVTFSPDGRHILTGLGDIGLLRPTIEPSIRVWNAFSGEAILAISPRRIEGIQTAGFWPPAVLRVAYSPNGSQIIALLQFFGAVGFWDAVDGRLIKTVRNVLPNSPVVGDRVALAVDPNGRRIFTSSGQTIQIWDANSSDPILRLNGHEGAVECLELSRDGALLASGAQDKTVRIWDTRSAYTP
jgi:WD40 repeat protein/serine/threonine protein kinase